MFFGKGKKNEFIPACPHCSAELKEITVAVYSKKKMSTGTLTLMAAPASDSTSAEADALPVYVCGECKKILSIGSPVPAQNYTQHIGSIDIQS